MDVLDQENRPKTVSKSKKIFFFGKVPPKSTVIKEHDLHPISLLLNLI